MTAEDDSRGDFGARSSPIEVIRQINGIWDVLIIIVVIEKRF
jgi:hypothetical protein